MANYDDFETSGDDFETSGLLNTNLSSTIAKAGASPSPTARAIAARFGPAALRAMATPAKAALTPAAQAAITASARALGVTEARAREIVAEELGALFESGLLAPPSVPWSGMPTRRGPRDESMWPLGLGVLTITAGTGTATQFLTVSPQRPFRGERLVIETRRFGAPATVDPPTVLISDFSVGDIPQRLGGGALPASVFQPDAQGVRLSLDATVPGVTIRIGVTVDQNTLAAGDGIVVSGAIIGRSVDGWRG